MLKGDAWFQGIFHLLFLLRVARRQSGLTWRKRLSAHGGFFEDVNRSASLTSQEALGSTLRADARSLTTSGNASLFDMQAAFIR